MDIDTIIEMYALAILDEYNKDWTLSRVPSQIKEKVVLKINEIELKEGEKQ